MDSHNWFKVFLDPFNLQIFIEHLLCHTLRQVPWLNKINPTWILISRFKLLFYSVRWLTFYCVCLNKWTVDKAQQSMGGESGGHRHSAESSEQTEVPSHQWQPEKHVETHTSQYLLGKETYTPSWQDPVSYPSGRFLPSEPGCPQAKHSDVRCPRRHYFLDCGTEEGEEGKGSGI